MPDASHECPGDGCTRRVGAGMLMCRPHWYMVPRPLRDAVWDAWRNGMGAGSPAHRHACSAAIGALNEKLAASGPGRGRRDG